MDSKPAYCSRLFVLILLTEFSNTVSFFSLSVTKDNTDCQHKCQLILQYKSNFKVWKKQTEDLSFSSVTFHGRHPNKLSELLKYQFGTWFHMVACIST